MKKLKILMLIALIVTLSTCSLLTEEEYNIQKFGTWFNPKDPLSFRTSYNFAVMDSNANLYIAVDNKLASLDMLNREVNEVAIFDGVISSLRYSQSNLYLSENKSVWCYNVLQKVKTKIVTTEGPVLNIYVINEDYILVNDDYGAWSTYHLIRLSDYKEVDSIEWVDPSESYVFVGSIKRLFHLRDGTIPDDICYNDINLDTGKITSNGDSPYHGDYELGHPLKLFPDESRILTSSGNIFKVSDMLLDYQSKITYIDVVFYNKLIYAINSNNELVVYSQTKPYNEVSVYEKYDYPLENIFLSNSTLYILMKKSNNEIGVDIIEL
jgi:hypothetical protein